MKIKKLTYKGVYIKTSDLTSKYKKIIESNFKNSYQGEWKDLYAYKYLNLYNSEKDGLRVIGFDSLNHTDFIVSPSFLFSSLKSKLK